MGKIEILASNSSPTSLPSSSAATTTEDIGTDVQYNQQDNPGNVNNECESRDAQPFDRRFAFEMESNCLPMYVKRTLDRLAVKVSHAQWLSMTHQERTSIGELVTVNKEDREIARELIRDILRRYGSEPTLLPQSVERFADPPAEAPAEVIESAREVGVLLDQEKWSKLNTNQRYALTKLIDSGKRNKRKRALIEFFGMAQCD
jgi:hypothetical protein